MSVTLWAIPASHTAGSTTEYYRPVGERTHADGWDLKLYLAGASAAVSITAAETTSGWLVTIPSTQALLPGVYQWTEREEKTGYSYEVGSGSILVKPDIRTAAAGQFQADCEKALAMVRASLTGAATDDVARYVVGDRALFRYTMDEKLKLYNLLKGEVAALRRGGTFSRPVLFRFTQTEEA